MSTSPERWKKIEEIFLTAIDLDNKTDRDSYLATACAGDAELRQEVERLLAQDEGAETLMKETVFDESGMHDFAAFLKETDPLLGTRLGSYRILSEIGRGGMGAVYLADRADGAFRQRVAIKLVKRGMDTNFILRRFRQERQILATLNHPFIARLLNGGTTADGLPYFVMEYIEGQSLYHFSDGKKLSVFERLQLFRQVCEAVDYAHQNNVVHRDLKPSNVMVSAENTPKLLDFGIAKVLNPELSSDTIDPTATHMRLMTPEYASPEQIKGESVTATSDIYSLGVLLYELLTGHRPYRFRNRAPHEISRAVCEDEPESPSKSLTREDNFAPTGAGDKASSELILTARNTTLENLRQALAGDLDKIILKALRKEPAERYQSVAALARDITNYLENRPVLAEPFAPDTNRLAAVSEPTTEKLFEKRSVAILPLHVLGSTSSEDTGEMYLGIGLADALILRLSKIPRFIVRPTSSVLRYQNATVDPFQAGRELDVEFVVEGTIRRVGERIRVAVRLLSSKDRVTRWAQNFDENFTDVLELEDSISDRIAHSLVPRLTGEEERQISKRGTNNAQAYEAYLRGRYFYNQFSEEGLQKAVASFREAIALDPNYALPHVGIADYYIWAAIFGQLPSDEAFPLAKLETRRALELDDQLGEAYAILAFSTLLFDWDWVESERLIKRALELSPNYYFAHECYSNWFASQKRFAEAIQEIKRAEELDPLSPRAMLMTAWTLYQARHYEEAVNKARKANDLRKDFPQGLLHLGNTLTQAGRPTEAIPLLRQSSRLWEESGMPQYMLVCALAAAGKQQEARQVFEALKAATAKRYVKPYFLAVACAALGEFDDAFAWFEKAVAERSEWMIWLATEANLDRLRQDARYPALLQQTNNPLAPQQKIVTQATASAGSEKSLAVLPFKLLNPNIADASGDFIGVGLADALITRLSMVRRFVVRPTSSVLRFGDAADSFQAGRELGVDFVLEGSIRRSADRIRVTIQLLSVSEQAASWAGSFDEKNTDVLELEDSISERVAKALIPHLTGEEQRQLSKRGTNNAGAYEAYLRGRYYWNQFTPESLPKALAAFELAIALDPNYALAYVGLADFYVWANIYGLIPSTALAQAEAAARRAIELNDQLGEAYASLGLIMQNHRRWEEAERLKQKAIELSPNYVHAHEWYASQLVGLGRTAEGIEEIKLAQRLDPYSLRTENLAAWMFYQAHCFEEGLECGQLIVDMDKNHPQGYSQIALNLLALGQPAEALASFQKFDELMPNSALAKYQLCFGYVAVGRLADARRVLEEIKSLATQTYVKPYFLAMAHTALGERDEAFKHFNQAFDEAESWMQWFGTEPMLAPLHDDKRFVELLKRMNNPLVARFEAQGRKPEAPKTFAVLPFKIHSVGTSDEDTEDRFLGLGLTDALITRLSKVQHLIVRPTSSVLRFSDQTDAFEAGQALATEFVLDGNIRRVGDRLRVSMQLLSVSDHATCWAQTFNEKMTDVLELEDTISEKVVASLLPHLTGQEPPQLPKRATDNAEAFEAYLRGRYHWNTFTEEGFVKAIGAYQKAIALDPTYAQAYAGIADYFNWLGVFGVLPAQECFQNAINAATRAIELNEELSEAHAALAFAMHGIHSDWRVAEKHHLRALELNPHNATAHVWYSIQLCTEGRFEASLEHAHRGIELDPLTPFNQHHLGWALYFMQRYDESIAQYRRVVAEHALYPLGYFGLSWGLRNTGQYEEAIRMAKRAADLSNDSVLMVLSQGQTFAAAGMRAEAEKVMTQLVAPATERQISAYHWALVYAYLGDKEKTLAMLKKADEVREAWLVWMGVEPVLSFVQAEPTFGEIFRRTGNPLSQQQHFANPSSGNDSHT